MVAYGVVVLVFCEFFVPSSAHPPPHSARFLCVQSSSFFFSFYWAVAAYLTFWRTLSLSLLFRFYVWSLILP